MLFCRQCAVLNNLIDGQQEFSHPLNADARVVATITRRKCRFSDRCANAINPLIYEVTVDVRIEVRVLLNGQKISPNGKSTHWTKFTAQKNLGTFGGFGNLILMHGVQHHLARFGKGCLLVHGNRA